MKSTYWACALGSGLGLVYTLSPMSVWFGAAMFGLFAWAGHALGRRERLWVFGLLATGVGLRILAIIVFAFVVHPEGGSFPSLIPDEANIALRAKLLRYVALDVPLAGSAYMEAANTWAESGLHELLAYLQLQLGESPYGIRLFSAALHLIGCVILYRATRASFGGVVALGGLAVLLFLPTMFVWSISTLKEPISHFLTAVAVGSAMALWRTTWPVKRALLVVLGAAAVLALVPFRPGGAVMVGGGILGGLALAVCVRRPAFAWCALALSLAAVAYGVRSPTVRQSAAESFQAAATYHLGYVHTVGWNYKLLDPEFYERQIDLGGNVPPARVRLHPPHAISSDQFTAGVVTRYAIRALASVFLVPLPWMAASTPMLVYLPEQVMLYGLVVFAVVGTLSGVRRNPYETLVLAGTVALCTGFIAISAGNVGTLIRHRGLVLVVLPWLSSLGVFATLQWVAGRWSMPSYEFPEARA